MVLRLLRGEDLDPVSREVRVTAATLTAGGTYVRGHFLDVGGLAVISLAAACSTANQSSPNPPASLDGSAAVDAMTCPTERDGIQGKIYHRAYLEGEPGKEHAVTVWMRQASLPTVVDCPNDTARDARCPSRDEALTERQRLNVQELDCAFGVLGARVGPLQTVWYEEAYHLTSGQPVPIGLAFNLWLSWSQIALLAQHPFVERIEPPPGGMASTGIVAPPPPPECPMQLEASTPKLNMLVSIRGQGRQPTVVEVKDKGVLPEIAECSDGSLCPTALNSLWERTILNTRGITCLKRRLDAVVKEQSPPVPYTGLVGSPLGTPLPPAGQPPMTVKAFGFGLTWEEATQVAEHSAVESIWTASGIQFEQPLRPGCPPDLTAPVLTVECTTTREPTDGKISDADRMRFVQTSGFMEVLITVKGGGTICMLPPCSAPPCLERDSIISHWTAQNLASQRCVRELVTSLGGAGRPETLWLTDAFVATLTWDQIQLVAGHPHVKQIESNGGTPPPRP